MLGAVFLISALAATPAPPPAAPPEPSPTLEVTDEGFLLHRPSLIRLLRELRGPDYTHRAVIVHLGPDGAEIDYGPITVTIGPPTAAADPRTTPPGMTLDPHPPVLPALRFWGDAAQPQTISFLAAGGDNWISFSVVVEGWQIVLGASYETAHRETVVKTAEAVWAMLASANEDPPR